MIIQTLSSIFRSAIKYNSHFARLLRIRNSMVRHIPDSILAIALQFCVTNLSCITIAYISFRALDVSSLDGLISL